MYEGIIDSLVKLTALVTYFSNQRDSKNIENVLSNYLNHLFGQNVPPKYTGLFQNYIDDFHSTITSSELDPKVHCEQLCANICLEVNDFFEIAIRQQLVLRLVEFSCFKTAHTPEKEHLIRCIQEELKLDPTEFENIFYYTIRQYESIPEPASLLLINGEQNAPLKHIHHFYNENQIVHIYFLYIRSTNQLFTHYEGERNLYLNAHKLSHKGTHVVPSGAILKTSRIHPIYYNSIISFFTQSSNERKICYTVDNISYSFSKKVMGVHPFSLSATSGHLIGIMGGSGVGKSTLFNLMNGNIIPDQGCITINNFDLHKDADKVEGLIGYVPQDDLLVEELTVFQNLYYNAKLCFGNSSTQKILEAVEQALEDFDLVEARDLQVGSPLKKIISGGQRKRLNIALELIRKPAVLFVDEPTSGLSSADSEKVMSLLKGQCLKGGLVFANIHQPSSDIFKMLDGLIILDKGGRVVYQGNPMDAITYFKREAQFLNPDTNECMQCGNVQAEQPLRIIETRMVAPTGKQIRKRKVSPEKWYASYKEKLEGKLIEKMKTQNTCKDKVLPERISKVPSRIQQFKVFIQRDLRAKWTNKAYIRLALLQSPLLALMLSYFTKYVEHGGSYHFASNVNLSSYLFMSIVVALFVGLTVSAEEIFKDRRLLKREQFLNLSRSAYLSSKVLTLFGLSAIQSLMFVLIGNYILEIQGMTLSYWLLLFATSCFANALGLNLSAGLNSAVAIYISIPLILVPQLIFSGVVVNFKNMHHMLVSQKYTMVVGDMNISRWSYEALAVNQFCNNRYNKHFFHDNLQKNQASYIFAHYIPRLEERINRLAQLDATSAPKEKENLLHSITINLRQLAQLSAHYDFTLELQKEIKPEQLPSILAELEQCTRKEKERFTQENIKLEEINQSLITKLGSTEELFALKQAHHNRSLSDAVLERNNYERIVEENGLFVQNNNNIYQIATHPWGRAHFYAPFKTFAGLRIYTPVFNLLVIFASIAILLLTLYLDLLKRFTDYLSTLKVHRAAVRAIKKGKSLIDI